jgi:hypothetical protein
MPTPPIDSLAGVRDWWIWVGCGCGHASYVPVKILIRQCGDTLRPAEVVARMKCRRCGARPPARAELIDNIQSDATGYVGGSEPIRIDLSGLGRTT